MKWFHTVRFVQEYTITKMCACPDQHRLVPVSIRVAVYRGVDASGADTHCISVASDGVVQLSGDGLCNRVERKPGGGGHWRWVDNMRNRVECFQQVWPHLQRKHQLWTRVQRRARRS